MGDLKSISLTQVAEHNTPQDCWFVINGKVYDVTNFLGDHPGGEDALTAVAGTDATNDFEDIGHSDSAKEQMQEFLVGIAEGHEQLSSSSFSAPKSPSIIEQDTTTPAAADNSSTVASFFLRFVVPAFILGLAFLLRFFAKKDYE